MALADLALQMQSWTTVVEDLIGRFSGDMATVPVLLDILIVLPEEVGTREREREREKERERVHSL